MVQPEARRDQEGAVDLVRDGASAKIRSRSFALEASRTSSSSGRRKLRCGLPHALQEPLRPRVRRVDEGQNAAEVRDEELVELELLVELVTGTEDTGQVPFRVRGTLDEAVTDGSDGWRNTIGMRSFPFRVAFCACLDRRVLEGDDDVHVVEHEHAGLCSGLLRLEVPPDELDVLALGPPELGEARLQAVERRRDVVDPDVHQPHALQLASCVVLAVRARAPRSDEEGRRKCYARERQPVPG